MQHSPRITILALTGRFDFGEASDGLQQAFYLGSNVTYFLIARYRNGYAELQNRF